MQPPDPAAMRERYGRSSLVEADVPADPLELFAAWFVDVVGAGVAEPNAMVLATVSPQGRPEARTVLLKGYGGDGLRFFTHTSSAKGVALAARPVAALVFPWHPIERQVRVTGEVVALSVAEVAEYFATRPRESQLGAWASPQSEVVASREDLDRLLAAAQERFPEGVEVPVPPSWGGYRVVPDTWEFWAGRPGRMHDRLRYRRTASSEPWHLERLAP
ncbi:MAG: pyridoxamine 5'-phosphate oxidase [Spirochaetaceae bacterium]|nr:pyridoxamine 5'-phosphate oxidase [Spirochaetaceae bacterium]